jgi:hypothetical protein
MIGIWHPPGFRIWARLWATLLLIGLLSGAATRLRCRLAWLRMMQVTTGSLLLVITGYYL